MTTFIALGTMHLGDASIEPVALGGGLRRMSRE